MSSSFPASENFLALFGGNVVFLLSSFDSPFVNYNFVQGIEKKKETLSDL
jgi:hypothetical protein